MSRKINKLDIHRIYKQSSYFKTVIAKCLLGVGLMIRVVDSGSLDPEFKPHLAVELILSGVDSACHPFEVSKMSASILCRSGDPSRTVSNSQGECSSAAPTLWTECGPNGWMDCKISRSPPPTVEGGYVLTPVCLLLAKSKIFFQGYWSVDSVCLSVCCLKVTILN